MLEVPIKVYFVSSENTAEIIFKAKYENADKREMSEFIMKNGIWIGNIWYPPSSIRKIEILP